MRGFLKNLLNGEVMTENIMLSSLIVPIDASKIDTRNYICIDLKRLDEMIRDFLQRVTEKIVQENSLEDASEEDLFDIIFNRFKWILRRRLGLFMLDDRDEEAVIIGDKELAKNVLREILNIANLDDTSENKVNDAIKVDDLLYSTPNNHIKEYIGAMIQYNSLCYRLDEMKFTVKDKGFYFISYEDTKEIFHDIISELINRGGMITSLAKRILGVLFKTSQISGKDSDNLDLLIHFDLKMIGLLTRKILELPITTDQDNDFITHLWNLAIDISDEIAGSHYSVEGNYILLFHMIKEDKKNGLKELYFPAFQKFSSVTPIQTHLVATIFSDLLFGWFIAKALKVTEAYVIPFVRTYLKPSKFTKSFGELLTESRKIFRGASQIRNMESLTFLPPARRYDFGLKIIMTHINYLIMSVLPNIDLSLEPLYYPSLFERKLTYDIEWNTELFREPSKIYLRPAPLFRKIGNQFLLPHDIRIHLIPIYLYFDPIGDLELIINKLKLIEAKMNELLGLREKRILLSRDNDGSIKLIKIKANVFHKILNEEFTKAITRDPRRSLEEILYNVLSLNGYDLPFDEFLRMLPHYDVLSRGVPDIVLPLIILDDRNDEKGDRCYLLARMLAILFDIPVFPVRYKTLKEKISENSVAIFMNILRGILSRCHLIPLDVKKISLNNNEYELGCLRDWLLIGVGLYKVGNAFQGAVATVAQLSRIENPEIFRHYILVSFKEILEEEMEMIIETVSNALRSALKLSQDYKNVLLELPYVLEHWRVDEQITYLRKILNKAFRDLRELLKDKNIYVLLHSDNRLPRIFEESNLTLSNPSSDVILEGKEVGDFHLSFLCSLSIVIPSRGEKEPCRTILPRRIKIYRVSFNDDEVRLQRIYGDDAIDVLVVHKFARLLRVNTPISIVKETLPTLIALKYRALMRILYKYKDRGNLLESLKSLMNIRINLENEDTIKLERAGVWALV